MMYGQDRYRRRYWVLPHCGGVFIEAMESGEGSYKNAHTLHVKWIIMLRLEDRTFNPNFKKKTDLM